MITFKDKQKTIHSRLNNLREKATKHELIVKSLLDSINEYYIFQKGFIKGNFYCIVDFYLPKRKLVIEVDGGYHFSDEQRRKDATRDNYLKNERGFNVLRISNNAAENIDSESLQILISKSCGKSM